MSLPFSMADFVPCDRLLQKAYLRTSQRFIDQDRERGLRRMILVNLDNVTTFYKEMTMSRHFINR